MTPLIVSVSGVRGIIGESLGPVEATRFGLAFGSFLKQQDPNSVPAVAIGRDSRPSGPMICAALSAGLMAAGCRIIDLGIVTTPGTALMTRHLQCQGGVVITASHNPVQWNGIKFLRHDGIAFPADQVKQIQQRYFDQNFNPLPALDCQSTESNPDTHSVHINRTLEICDPDLIASKKFKVVLDSVNGAGCVGTAQLLEKLGCDLIHLNNQPTGIFAHTPEPTADNLAELGPQICSAGAAVGFAQDPDADRLAIIDEKGKYIGEEYTLALAAKYIFSKNPGLAAVNLSTSRMIDDLAAAAGCTVLRTPVGEAHVANAMVANNCVIGGEGNGGIIDLRVGPVRDSFVGIALILQLLAETGKTVSQLVAEIPAYHMTKTKFPCPQDQTAAVLTKVRDHYTANAQKLNAKVDTSDGIRIDLPNAWVQLRASNTEPIMRIMAESQTPQQTQSLINDIQALIKQ
ncbi:MAG: phosphoglucosamine mutase [Sedimentisphaerales bacterium]|nr:phosphoglucosamine mutase [Sedimentisphaerales bacterium]